MTSPLHAAFLADDALQGAVEVVENVRPEQTEASKEKRIHK